MKNIIRLVSILLICLFFTSCVDYVQSVTFKSGKYHMYYKETLSKLLFAMADEDPEEIFRNFDEDEIGELPPNTSIKPVNTELEVGAEFTFEIDPKTTDETEKSFLPTVAGKKCFIPFLLGQNDSISDSVGADSEGKEFGAAIMSSAKCRILLSKNLIPEIETAYFEGKGGQNFSIPVFDYGEANCLEIPFIILTQEGIYRTDRIVIIKK